MRKRGGYVYGGVTSNEVRGTVEVDGDAVIRNCRAFATMLGIGVAPIPYSCKITANDLMPLRRQVLRYRGEVVFICGIDQSPEGVIFDEIVVHPDHYEVIKTAMEKA